MAGKGGPWNQAPVDTSGQLDTYICHHFTLPSDLSAHIMIPTPHCEPSCQVYSLTHARIPVLSVGLVPGRCSLAVGSFSPLCPCVCLKPKLPPLAQLPPAPGCVSIRNPSERAAAWLIDHIGLSSYFNE